MMSARAGEPIERTSKPRPVVAEQTFAPGRRLKRPSEPRSDKLPACHGQAAACQTIQPEYFQALARQLTSSADQRRVLRVHKLKGHLRPPLGREARSFVAQ